AHSAPSLARLGQFGFNRREPPLRNFISVGPRDAKPVYEARPRKRIIRHVPWSQTSVRSRSIRSPQTQRILEREIFPFFTIFSFSVIYFSTSPGGIPELQKPITIYEHQSWWTGRDLNPRPSGHPRRIFPMRTGRSTAQAAH